MKITFINRMFGAFWGGGETFDLEAGRALTKLGHKINIVTRRNFFKIRTPEVDLPVDYIVTPYLVEFGAKRQASNSRLVRKIGTLAKMIDLDLFERIIFKKIKAGEVAKGTEIFQINALPRLGAWLRRYLGVPVVNVYHGPPNKELLKWNGRCSATFSFGDALNGVRCNVDPQAIEIPPGIDTSKFFRREANGLRKKYGIPDEGIVLIFVGRLIWIKNLPLLLKSFSYAIKENPLLYLLIVGDGPIKSSLQKDCPNENVIFTGKLMGEELVAHYSIADIFVITSFYENLPFVTLEAMACELPVIAPRVGYLPNLVNQFENGLLVEPNNIEELKSAVVALAANSKLRDKMGKEGKKFVQTNYDWNETAMKMQLLYETLINK